MDCRKCGACCIAPSITTAIPNMPHGKPAGARCANLNDKNECTLYGKAGRPAFASVGGHARYADWASKP
jgi:Fe-S-cluster containining protein